MKKTIAAGLFCIAMLACSHKNLAQTTTTTANQQLILNINSSTGDTTIIIPHLNMLQQQNDLVIAFATLNYAWLRKGDFYVLTNRENTWQLYRYQTKLPPSAEEEAAAPAPQSISPELAEKIKNMYAGSQLWKTGGDNGGNFCNGRKDCNITDAETWTISVTTPQTIHTTTYYAPQFFEKCCPGNAYRQQFIAIANAMIALGKNQSPFPEK